MRCPLTIDVGSLKRELIRGLRYIMIVFYIQRFNETDTMTTIYLKLMAILKKSKIDYCL